MQNKIIIIKCDMVTFQNLHFHKMDYNSLIKDLEKREFKKNAFYDERILLYQPNNTLKKESSNNYSVRIFENQSSSASLRIKTQYYLESPFSILLNVTREDAIHFQDKKDIKEVPINIYSDNDIKIIDFESISKKLPPLKDLNCANMLGRSEFNKLITKANNPNLIENFLSVNDTLTNSLGFS